MHPKILRILEKESKEILACLLADLVLSHPKNEKKLLLSYYGRMKTLCIYCQGHVRREHNYFICDCCKKRLNNKEVYKIKFK